MKIFDSIVIGGGQAGLSVGYFFRRYQIDYLILDDQREAGGSWLSTWDSLKLFSPVQYSSLSGWMMPKGADAYPSRDEFVNYLNAYEKRYDFPILRPITVIDVTKEDDLFRIETNQGLYYSRTLVSATGNSHNPFIPDYPDADKFTGTEIHSSQYRKSADFEGDRVLIVGGGNSGAQVLAEVSKVAETQWVTPDPPQFLPDHIDGRYLFQEATNKFLNKQPSDEMKFSLGNIVMLDSVKEALSRGVLNSKRPFVSFYEKGVIWPDDEKEDFDAVIWCTGFRSNLDHLSSLGVIENNKISTKYTRSVREPNLWLVGYGNWTGFASATIYGVGKTAKNAALEIDETIRELVL